MNCVFRNSIVFLTNTLESSLKINVFVGSMGDNYEPFNVCFQFPLVIQSSLWEILNEFLYKAWNIILSAGFDRLHSYAFICNHLLSWSYIFGKPQSQNIVFLYIRANLGKEEFFLLLRIKIFFIHKNIAKYCLHSYKMAYPLK